MTFCWITLPFDTYLKTFKLLFFFVSNVSHIYEVLGIGMASKGENMGVLEMTRPPLPLSILPCIPSFASFTSLLALYLFPFASCHLPFVPFFYLAFHLLSIHFSIYLLILAFFSFASCSGQLTFKLFSLSLAVADPAIFEWGDSTAE